MPVVGFTYTKILIEKKLREVKEYTLTYENNLGHITSREAGLSTLYAKGDI